MDIELGRFGDRRLQKGGSFCSVGWLKLAAEACVFGALAAAVRERCG